MEEQSSVFQVGRIEKLASSASQIEIVKRDSTHLKHFSFNKSGDTSLRVFDIKIV